MSFEVRSIPSGGVTLVVVTGEVDIETGPRVRSVLQAAVRDGRPVTVDLGAVTFMDSAGFGALVATHQQAQRSGTELRLRAVPPRISQLLAMLGLDTVLRVEADGPDDTARVAG